ncbi:hypothetical protein H4R33_000553 [Dimargaris cristalligena]|uniref:Small acidic protein n=1 Tax=Dimargaris cristalligena TaxID=215637 RepID=A0A4Q0A0W7_9FUNG|nr:hypothetical protein H4R33_000553 [Dimargaris cristalligena]RKP39746.1 small acidic protein family-domain-containing protein [Dimargaris cristalligena]|eukprot:RKP39746.1 small acidic protein family-domain-containing protein [Dimargaris cristalligena]
MGDSVDLKSRKVKKEKKDKKQKDKKSKKSKAVSSSESKHTDSDSSRKRKRNASPADNVEICNKESPKTNPKKSKKSKKDKSDKENRKKAKKGANLNTTKAPAPEQSDKPNTVEESNPPPAPCLGPLVLTVAIDLLYCLVHFGPGQIPEDDPFVTKSSWTDWSQADFGANDKRKNKFLRLMGAKKTPEVNPTNPKKNLLGTLAGAGSSDTTASLSRSAVAKVNQNLSQQFTQGLQMRKNRQGGLGFSG